MRKGSQECHDDADYLPKSPTKHFIEDPLPFFLAVVAFLPVCRIC